METVLELRGATKDFRGVYAIRDIDLKLGRGEVHAILGENGAGKSTLMKALAGVHQLSAGEILMEGAPVTMTSPSAALKQGIAMVFQETNLVGSMTVAQNIYLGEEKFLNRLRGLNIRAQTYLLSMNFDVDPTALVSTLGAAQRQMVEVARATHHTAKVIIFDEPTATLTPEEKHHFFGLLRRLKARGVSILFITHALEEALAHSDRITVLRDGRKVAEGAAAEFDRDRVIQAMVGRGLSGELYGARKGVELPIRKAGRKLLSVDNLSMGKIVRNSSFSVYGGQVTGMFGLVGSGRTETMKIVAGAFKRNFFHGGEVRLDGRPVRYRVPRGAMRDGIVYVTEDRKLDGFFETMSIRDNILAGRLAQGSNPLSLVSMAQAQELAQHWTKALDIRAIDPSSKVIELSGGNQQKVVIAKALVQKPRLVIFDEPTRGVDVGSIVEIHGLVNRLADEGIAVVLISSYLPEILSLSDRILVARQGQIVEEMNAAEATEERIMYAAVH
ncbi:sugar ABC transporter ATP-binding protein [Celeribacter indicus]|uniref:Ribose ABC transporter ATP-binding protein n=1 Tax=Celeribacter indicus TaxID=1208324 RepID=A0A0B5E0A9_9RHOB|nr:sugar ABC transporter ATP-binding protein [Celeribacter indicus]AJE49128.1 ribose ABC transporter ATP-binding protein [Celeribacter indicus]SDX17127.1 simple sugar transport system ATP-binding protein/ribose transport system ATP-binding protein [Celeribacter indicus]